MTDYNDGKWHGWSGGECPVEVSPMSEVRWKNADGHEDETIAGPLNWTGHRGSPVIAFRVTKPAPPKPREWHWNPGLGGGSYELHPQHDPVALPPGWIHVIEKLPK